MEQDIQRALKLELQVPPHERALYLDVYNDVPMSERVTTDQLRQGCILQGVYLQASKDHPMLGGTHWMVREQVAPLRQDAVTKAKQRATEDVEGLRKELEENDYDQLKVAPLGDGTESGRVHERLAQRYYQVNRLVIRDESKPRSILPDAPQYVKVCPTKVQKYIEQAGKDAALQYDAFVDKLSDKVTSKGIVTKVELRGNHVWNYSYLIVDYAGGAQLYWKTQMIINTSKLGKVFNQFPTRRVKDGAKLIIAT